MLTNPTVFLDCCPSNEAFLLYAFFAAAFLFIALFQGKLVGRFYTAVIPEYLQMNDCLKLTSSSWFLCITWWDQILSRLCFSFYGNYMFTVFHFK